MTDDTKTLNGYNVKPNSTLDLVDANRIYITTHSGPRTITIDVDPPRLQDWEGIPVIAPRKIVFTGKPLANWSLLDDHVPKCSCIVVVKEKLRKTVWRSCHVASWNEPSKHCIKVDPPRDLNEEGIARRTAEDAKKDGQDTKTSAIASTVSARDYGLSEAILMGVGCTGTGVSMVPSPTTSASVVANVPCRRDRSVGPIHNVKGCAGVMTAEIEHFVHTISVFVVLLRMSVFIMIGCVLGANAIHSTIANGNGNGNGNGNVPEDLLLIGLMLTAKRLETIGCTSCICSEMGTLTQNNFMNGICYFNLYHWSALCVAISPSYFANSN